MIHALDTHIIVDLLRGKDPALARAYLAREPGSYAVPEMVRAELLFGAALSARREDNTRLVEQFLAPLALIPFEGEACTHYADIRAHLQREGRSIGPNDLIIAATARAHGHTLVTRNLAEFSHVPGLAVVAW